MLFFSMAIYFFVAFLTSKAIFHKFSITYIFISFFLLAFSINILICEILSLFNQINNPPLFLVLQLGLCAIYLFILYRKDKINKAIFSLRSSSKENKFDTLTWIFIALICFNLAILFYVGIKTPPNNLDSLHTHISRIYYWLQHGSFASWQATGVPQLVYPINGNIQGLWLFLLGHNEELFFLVQWFSLIIICCSVYEIGKLLKFSIHQSLVGCLALLTFSVVLLQTYSFQGDLTVTALISIFILFIFSYQSSRNISDLITSMLALALALGVKQTAFILLPAIILFIVYEFITHHFSRNHAPYFALFFIFFLFFSSYKYIQNIAEFGSFFGQSDVVSDQTFSVQANFEKAKYNIPRYTYNAISFEGLTKAQMETLTAAKANLFKTISSWFQINLENEVFLQKGFDQSERFLYTNQPFLSEDTSWFGPLADLLIPLSILIVLLKKDRRRKEYLLFTVFINVSYFAGIFLQRPGWDPYQGRYFILAVIPFMPLAGIWFPEKKFFRSVCAILFCGIYMFLSFNILCMNQSKPVITTGSVTHWQNTVLKLPENNFLQIGEKKVLFKLSVELINNAPQKISILDANYFQQLFYSTGTNLSSIELVNYLVPEKQPLYIKMSTSPLEYSLFGINRSRALYPVQDVNQVEENGYLLIQDDMISSLRGFKFLGSDSKYSLYQKSG